MEQILKHLMETVEDQNKRMDVLSERIDIANKRINNLVENNNCRCETCIADRT